MRRATLSVLIGLLLLVAGCGDSSEETTTTTSTPLGGGGDLTREVRSDWERNPDCKRPGGASRWGCSVDPYRCQAVVTGRGWSVSCAKPGQSITFRVEPG